MSPLHRRSAERFDDLLEGRLDDAALDRRTTELVELVGAMRAVPAPQARPEFVSDLRAQLMAAAETELVPAARDAADVTRRLTIAPRTPERTRRDRRVRVALGSIAVAGAVTSMGVASQAAVPGDTLYPVKRVLESTQTTFSVSQQAKGTSLLASASDRLGEVRELAQRDEPDLADQTLATFTSQATEGGGLLLSDYRADADATSIARLTDFTSSSMTTLTELKALLPDSSREALLTAANALVRLDEQAATACPDCAGVGLVDVPGTLLASAPLVEVPEVAPPVAEPTPTPTEEQQVSGLEAPSNPVSVTPVLPSETPDPTTPAPTQPAAPTATPTQQAGGQQQGPKGPKGTGLPLSTPSLGGITDGLNGTLNGTLDTATQVVNGVVQGVTGLLGGLTGQTPGPTPKP